MPSDNGDARWRGEQPSGMPPLEAASSTDLTEDQFRLLILSTLPHHRTFISLNGFKVSIFMKYVGIGLLQQKERLRRFRPFPVVGADKQRSVLPSF